MIESNNEKTFTCISFYNADKKLCEYEKFFGEKSKNQDKSIQSGTLKQKPQTMTVLAKPRQLECFSLVGTLVDTKINLNGKIRLFTGKIVKYSKW